MADLRIEPGKPIQERFDGGEVSPRIRGRVSSELYKKALRESTNFEPLAQGSLRMRSGSELQQALTGDNRTRFIQIRMSNGQDYLVELLDKKLHLYPLSGSEIDPALGGTGDTTPAPEPVGQSELITNGNFNIHNGSGWLTTVKPAGGHDNTQAIDAENIAGVFFKAGAPIREYLFQFPGSPQQPVFLKTGYGPGVTPGDDLPYAEIDTAQGAGNAACHGVLYQRIVIPFDNTDLEIKFKSSVVPFSTTKVKISTLEPTAWADAGGGGDIFLDSLINLGIGDGLIDGDGNGSGNAPTFRQEDLVGIPAITGLNHGTYYLSFQVEGQEKWGFYKEISCVASYTPPIGGGGGGGPTTEIPTPWNANEVVDIHFATETGRDRTILVHPGHRPWYLLFGGIAGSWSFGDVQFTTAGGATPPLGWGDTGSVNVPGGWNWQGQSGALAAPNWPATVEVHDGRVYYAGEPAQKNRIVASKANDPDNFVIGSNPGDSIDDKIATKGAIRWLKSFRTLLAGTDLGNYSITGSTGTPLVGDIQIREESSQQSARIQANVMSTLAFFVSADFRRVRGLSFNLQTNGWEPRDITFAAEHITEDLVKELHHAWTPDSVLIVLLKSGKLALCTYEPAEEVNAWWTIDLGAPIVTASPAQGPFGAYLWVAVQRGATIYLEKIKLSENKVETLHYLDTSITGTSDGDGQFAGLDHLNGQQVRVLADGAYIGDYGVGNGLIQLTADNANKAITAGLPYLAKAVTLPKDIRSGKAQSPKIGVVLNNSASPKINGKRPPDRTPSTPMDTAEPLFTGKKTVGNLGWSDEDTITITQDLPFRTEICAIFSLTEVVRS